MIRCGIRANLASIHARPMHQYTSSLHLQSTQIPRTLTPPIRPSAPRSPPFILHAAFKRRTASTAAKLKKNVTTKTTTKTTKSPKKAAKSIKLVSEPESTPLVAKLSQTLAEVVASPLFYIVAGVIAVKLVSASENDYSIFILAALPITFLTALSKSSIGQAAQDSLNAKLPQLEAEAAVVRREHQQARQTSNWYGDSRPLWPSQLGGGAPHLTGELPGDYAFDPLGLGKNPEAFARNAEAELVHSRWAMLAAIGCLIPEILDQSGVALGEAVWWKVGAAKLKDDVTLNWGGIEGFRIAGRQGIWLIAACQAVLMGGPEYARYVGIKSLEPVGVFLPGDQNYPGGRPFDPFNYSGNAEGFVDQAVKEIKNGRLAMVAMLGYFVQAAVTRQGPVQNLLDFIADPVHNNIFKYL